MIEHKVLKTSLQFVDNILNIQGYKAIDWPFDACNLSLQHEDKKMSLVFESKNDAKLSEAYMGRLPDLSIGNGSTKIYFSKGYVWFNCPLSLSTDVQQMRMTVSRLQTSDFNESVETYLRIFQPIEKFDLFHDIHTFGYAEGKYEWSGRMEIKIDTLTVDVFPYDYNGQKYIVFESKSLISANGFSNKVFSICVALGLITKRVWQDEAITVEYTDDNFDCPTSFCYQTLRPTIYGTYSIFTTNVYWIEDRLNDLKNTEYAVDMLKTENGEVNRGLIDWLQPDFISSLCSLIDSQDSLRRAVSMLIEGSTYPMEYQPSMYCVALETITSYIKKKRNIKDTAPIPKDKFENGIISKFNEVLSDFERETPNLVENIKIIRNKLKSLNAPTNQDKLSLPFEAVGYKLTKQELEAIKNRNRFLHGSTLTLKSGEDEFDKLFQTNIILHKLCCILIFKEAGFNGYLLNNSVLYGFKEACEDKEPPLIEFKG